MLFQQDPVTGITKPMDYFYMKQLRFCLKAIGSWPKRDLGEKCTKLYSSLIYIQMGLKTVGLFLTVWYIVEYSRVLGFIEIGHSYITSLMSCVTLSRGFSLTLNQKYRNIVRRYINEMHMFHYKDKSEFAMKTHLRVHKISYIITLVLVAQMYIGVLTFNGMPLYNNYVSGKWARKNLENETYEFSLYYRLPYKVLSSRNGYIIVTVYNWYATYICSNYICIMDLLLSLMIFTVCGHFKILLNALTTIPKPATATCIGENNASKSILTNTQFYSPTEQAKVSKKLKECINYHRTLVIFVKDISEAFGPMLFVYYIFHKVTGCLVLLEISQEKAAVVRYGILTIVLYQQLIQTSVIVELVGTVTGVLKDGVYSVPWEYMDKSNRTLLIIFLMNVQEPVHINAVGLAKIGVQSMAAILKTSISYFAFLRTVSD